MSKGDVDAVAALEKRCFESPWSPGQFRHELKIPFSKTTLAWIDQPVPARVVGYICRWIVGDEVSILNVAVDPEFQRRGLGRALVNLVLDEARIRRATQVLLEVREKNDAARLLYTSLGFTASGVRSNYYGKSDHAILMSRVVGERSANEDGLCPIQGGGV